MNQPTGTSTRKPRTLAEKVWDEHVVASGGGTEPDLIYIDLHMIHEVTSPQAFEGLRLAGRRVRRPDLTIATEDHNVPTIDIDKPIADPVSRKQVETLRHNCVEFGIRLHPMGDIDQGIVHIIGPQLGLTQPGMTVVCGDSHTSTHGALGALAFGIGTSEVEHVLATQCLLTRQWKTMLVSLDGRLQPGVTAKEDRKSTRLNSSHHSISYAVFCLKKKKKTKRRENINSKTSENNKTWKSRRSD